MARTQNEQAVSAPDVCRLVTQASRLLALTISEPLCRLGVTPGQLGTLLELYRGDGRTQTSSPERLAWNSRPWRSPCAGWNAMA